MSSAELFLQQFIDLRGAGFAFAGLHDLTDQGVEGFFLAGAVFLDVLGVVGDHFVDDGLDGRYVGDLLEPLGFDDGVSRGAFAIPQRFEDFLGDVVGDGVVGNALHKAGELHG